MNRLIYFANNMNIGGVEKALVSRLNSLNLDDNQVTLVLEKKCGELLSSLDSRIRVDEYRLSTCRFVPLRKAINFSKRMLWRLKNSNKYDFSCSFCTYSVIGSRLAQYASKNSELWVHNSYSDIYPDGQSYCAFFNLLRASGFGSLVFVSNESLEGFIKVYPELEERCRVESNIINEEEVLRLSNLPLDVNRPEGKTIFIYMGRLEEEQKRLSRLLKAFETALEKRKDILLWIVGDGPDRRSYESLSYELGISDRVFFFGAQLNPYNYLKSADCLVLSSDYEGFPVVYQETIILGKSIITTSPASNNVFDIKKHAVIVDRNPEAIAKAMISFGE